MSIPCQISRHRLAPGQSRVSTASAFGRIGLLLAAAILTMHRAPAVAAAPDVPARAVPIEAAVPQRLACLIVDRKPTRCESSNSVSDARTG